MIYEQECSSAIIILLYVHIYNSSSYIIVLIEFLDP